MYFTGIYIRGCIGSDDEGVWTGEMRENSASPTVSWPSLREAAGNWRSQGVPASLGMRVGSTESLPKTQRETVSALSADQSLSNDLME